MHRDWERYKDIGNRKEVREIKSGEEKINNTWDKRSESVIYRKGENMERERWKSTENRKERR